MTTRTPQSPSTFTIWSVKAQETFTGTGGEAIARAKELDTELQPAFGTEVVDERHQVIWSSTSR